MTATMRYVGVIRVMYILGLFQFCTWTPMISCIGNLDTTPRNQSYRSRKEHQQGEDHTDNELEQGNTDTNESVDTVSGTVSTRSLLLAINSKGMTPVPSGGWASSLDFDDRGDWWTKKTEWWKDPLGHFDDTKTDSEVSLKNPQDEKEEVNAEVTLNDERLSKTSAAATSKVELDEIIIDNNDNGADTVSRYTLLNRPKLLSAMVLQQRVLPIRQSLSTLKDSTIGMISSLPLSNAPLFSVQYESIGTIAAASFIGITLLKAVSNFLRNTLSSTKTRRKSLAKTDVDGIMKPVSDEITISSQIIELSTQLNVWKERCEDEQRTRTDLERLCNSITSELADKKNENDQLKATTTVLEGNIQQLRQNLEEADRTNRYWRQLHETVRAELDNRNTELEYLQEVNRKLEDQIQEQAEDYKRAVQAIRRDGIRQQNKLKAAFTEITKQELQRMKDEISNQADELRKQFQFITKP